MRALLALNRRTLELFDAYRDAGIRFEMHATGLLIVARTLAGLHHYTELFRRLHELGARIVVGTDAPITTFWPDRSVA